MRLPRFIKFLSRDWAIKVISLCLAILLWYFVVGEDQVDTTIYLPIEILNLPSNVVISNQFKKDIEVSVRGPRSLILDLRNRNITIPVDLSNKKPGTIVVKSEATSIPLPRGISVLRLQPANITLMLDELVQQKIPVEAVMAGAPAPGYVLKGIIIEPDHLVIAGPQSVLRDEPSLKTSVVDITGANHSMSLQVQLNLKPELIELIGESVVSVTLEVGENFLERRVDNIPVNLREVESPVTIQPERISVLARIPENLLRETPEPAMLFRAAVSSADITSPTLVPISVTGVNVPGHEAIQVLSQEPIQVLVRPRTQEKSLPRQRTGDSEAPSS